ncbi:hypothetical protein JCM33374_g6538 [Metschnikowia sp. JCM 33374]|nr:hypothetical protein JCM33374_g6538 [Metschnikowia sp. JCM 33374]
MLPLKDPQLKLHATRTESHPQMPILLESRSALEEYHRVADEVVRLLCLSGGLVHLDDIAILTKTNDTAIAMQSVLKTRYGLPSYKLSSGNQWVASRLHILKQILGVIAGESSSNVSLMAILLTLDSETGGRKRVSKLFSESINKRSPGDMMFLETYLFGELSQAKDKTSTLSALYKKYPKVLERMAAFINQVQEERLILAETHASNPLLYNPAMLVSCLQRMANLDGISQFLKSDTHETSKATPLEILESFNDSIHHAYGKFSSKRDLQSTTFLDYFLQTYDSEVSSPVGNSIKVSTIHSAKGLEFPVVFILGQTLYAASWDKILQEEHAGKDMHKVANGPEHGRQTARGRNAGSLSFPEKDIVHENNSMQGPNSISRLLYVALSRARNLVYLGSRKPFEELSAITQARFTTTVPDLKPSAATCCGRASRRTETQGVISTDISQSSSGHGAEHRRRSDQVEQSSIFPGEDSPNPEMLASSLLNSIAEDVKRPIPARQKFDVGLDLFDSIMRKNAKLPVYYRKRGFANKTPEYPIIAGKRSPDALSSSLNRTANQSWHYAKSAIRRRAP